MGFTLQSLQILTTNENWDVEYIDRRAEDKPLYKILKIENFGFYYKPNDDVFISETTTDFEKTRLLGKLFDIGSTHVHTYVDDYLLEPMSMKTKLKIDNKSQHSEVNLAIKELAVCMQQTQLANIIRLIELDHEYNAQLEEHQMKSKRHFRKALEMRIKRKENAKSMF